MMESDLSINEKGYLLNNNKLVMVQIGKEIFTLKHWDTVDAPGKLEALLDEFDVRLLKEKEA